MATPFIQASCSLDQKITTADTPQKVLINTDDSSNDITLNVGTGEVTVDKAGEYLIVAAPQVGRDGDCFTIVPNFRCWLQVNGENVPNSNVLLNVNRERETKDVIVTQGIVELNKDDVVTVMMASNVDDEVSLEAIDLGTGEPLIPSIIFTMFSIQSGSAENCL